MGFGRRIDGLPRPAAPAFHPRWLSPPGRAWRAARSWDAHFQPPHHTVRRKSRPWEEPSECARLRYSLSCTQHQVGQSVAPGSCPSLQPSHPLLSSKGRGASASAHSSSPHHLSGKSRKPSANTIFVRRRNRPIQFTQNRWSKLIHKNT